MLYCTAVKAIFSKPLSCNDDFQRLGNYVIFTVVDSQALLSTTSFSLPSKLAEFLAHRRYFTPLASQTASEYRQVRRAASTALVATTPCSTTSWPAWQTTPGYHMALCGRLIDKGKTGQQPTVNTAGAHDAMLVENKCF
ncbi:uncharacterized protein LOC142769245 isoform X2 [Rhipicephalus microplus]|uniref:uncharacterized protein LOC142769245 isoform X2 n=1 Tax=Rhipicephalus microplus TaxID=6941 RepID=UPI003F6BC6DC